MSVAATFSILPYKSGQFLLPNGDYSKFSSQDRDAIINKYKKQRSSLFRKQDAKKLQNSLNNAVMLNSKDYEYLIDKVSSSLDNDLYKVLSENNLLIFKGSTFSLNTNASNYNKLITKIAKDFNLIKTGDDITKITQRISGSLNSLRGDIFENILAIVFDNSKKIMNNLEEITEEELTQFFIKNLKLNKNVKISHNEGYKGKQTAVVGAQKQNNLNLVIDGEKVSITGAQGKTDVKIPGLGGNPFLGISAKSYQSGKIGILNNANVAGLIASWEGANNITKNLAINGLSAKSISNDQFNLMKKIFMVQGLMGADNRSLLSEMFVINRNTEVDPFIVLSMYDLLFTDKIEGDFSDSKIVPINYKKGGRTPQQMTNFIKNSYVSIHTQLTVSKLAQLSKI